jgi:predicted RNA binding protein YcfA (HicA-like mRNA interferase family)
MNYLSSQIHESRVSPMRRSSEWDLATHCWRGLFNCEAVTRIVVPIGERPLIPWFNRPPLPLSVSTSELSKALRKQGYQLDKKGGKGSHLKFRAPGKPMVILPGNRKSLSYRVLKTTAEALGLPSVGDIKAILV